MNEIIKTIRIFIFKLFKVKTYPIKILLFDRRRLSFEHIMIIRKQLSKRGAFFVWIPVDGLPEVLKIIDTGFEEKFK